MQEKWSKEFYVEIKDAQRTIHFLEKDRELIKTLEETMVLKCDLDDVKYTLDTKVDLDIFNELKV